MLLYLILFITLLFILTNKFINSEGFKKKVKLKKITNEITCGQRHSAISAYPVLPDENKDVYKEKHIDLLFDATFKPECCPTPYSNSSGCLCLDMNHTELIKMRGGNRIMC